MGRKDDLWLLSSNGGNDLVDGGGDERRLGAFPGGPGLQHDGFRSNAAHFQNLAPPIAEPSIAHDQALSAGGELSRDGLHAERPAARHHHRAVRAVNRFQRG